MTMVLNAKAHDPSMHGGRSKVERHGWIVKGKPAEFAWVAKGQLQIDRRYQRDMNTARVNAMAREWDWVACGAISVALRSDGEWFVIDGQHRVEAARKRADILDLPCLIFEVESIKEEASGFLASNIGRKAMSYVERFNAMLQAGDETALRVEGMIDGSGRKIAKQPGPFTVSCVQSIYRAMATDEKACRRIWPVLTDVSTGGTLDNSVFNAFFWLETSLPRGMSLSDKRWHERVCRIGVRAIRQEINASVVYRGKGGPRSSGLGLLKAINKGLHKHNMLQLRPGREDIDAIEE